jgi:hypothetical protein
MELAPVAPSVTIGTSTVKEFPEGVTLAAPVPMIVGGGVGVMVTELLAGPEVRILLV